MTDTPDQQAFKILETIESIGAKVFFDYEVRDAHSLEEAYARTRWPHLRRHVAEHLDAEQRTHLAQAARLISLVLFELAEATTPERVAARDAIPPEALCERCLAIPSGSCLVCQKPTPPNAWTCSDACLRLIDLREGEGHNPALDHSEHEPALSFFETAIDLPIQ